MLYVKLFLAVMLAAMPFYYAYQLRPKQRAQPEKYNIFAFLTGGMRKLASCKKFLSKKMVRMNEGMKKFDSFRKFFTLVLLLMMIVVLFVDYHAATKAMTFLKDAMSHGFSHEKALTIYGSFMTEPKATIIASLICPVFFSYRTADKLLTALHTNKILFCWTGYTATIILIYSVRYFIIPEILLMVMLAAYIYPPKQGNELPKGKKNHYEICKNQEVKIAA